MRDITRIISRLLLEVWIVYEWLWGLVPGSLGMLVRTMTIAPFLSYTGSRFRSMWTIKIPELVHFWKPWNIIVGDHVRFGKYSQINAEGKITIGSDVMIGPYAMLTTVTHGYNKTDMPMRCQRGSVSEIVIEDDVWIGGHVSVLPGVTIKKGIVVGAGAVVSKTLSDPFSVYVGVPASKIIDRAGVIENHSLSSQI